MYILAVGVILLGLAFFFFGFMGLGFLIVKTSYFNAFFTFPENIAALSLLFGLALTISGIIFLFIIHERNERKKQELIQKDAKISAIGIKIFAAISFYTAIIFTFITIFDKKDFITALSNKGDYYLIVCIFPIYCGIQLLRLKQSGRYAYLFLSFFLYSFGLFHVGYRIFEVIASMVSLFSIQSSIETRAASLLATSTFYLLTINPIVAFYYFTRPKIKEQFK